VNMNNPVDNTYYSMKLHWTRGDIPANNTWDRNTYSQPFSNGDYIFVYDYVNYPGGDQSHNLAEWQTMYNQDLNGAEGAVKFSDAAGVSENEFVFFDYARDVSKTIPLSGTYLDAKGNPVGSSITLAPYTSVVLFKTANGSAPRPAAPAGLMVK